MKGKLPKGWENRLLGDQKISHLIMGQSPDSKSYNEIGIGLPFFQGKKDFGIKYPTPKVYCSSPIKIVENGDILMSVRAPVGPTNVCLETSCIGRGLAGIRANEERILKEYLLLFFKYFENEIRDKGKGSTFQAITKNDLENLEIPLPPLSEQKQIVSVLDKTFEKLDEAIVLAEENIQKLKQLNKNILDEVFEKRSKEWGEYIVSDKFTLYNGRAYNRDELLESGKYKVIRIQNLNGGTNWYYSNIELGEEKYCEKGDLLYSWSGTPGSSFGAFIWNEEKAIYHYHIWKVEIDKQVNARFALYLFKHITDIAISNSHGVTGMMHISKGKMENLPIQIPSEKVQLKAVSYLDQTIEKIQKLIQHYQNKLTTLKRLKNSILDGAFKGELKRAKVISITQPTTDPFFAKKKDWNAKKNADNQVMIIALAMEAHEKIGKSLYRTKGEKTVEVIEKHIDLDFGREVKKMAAGPAAFEHLVKVVEPLAKEKKWFSVQEVKGENYDSHKYIKGENFNAFMMRCVLDLRPNLQEIKRVIELFANMKTTHEAEVVATTYSGWNNLIIRKTQINDEAIVIEARENWHDSKLKIERQEFFNAIEWLKKNNLIPQGNGKEVI